MEEEITEEVVVVPNINNSLCILCCSIIPSRVLSVEDEAQDDNNFIDKLVKFEDELNEIVSMSGSSKISRKTSLPSSTSRDFRGSSVRNKRLSGYHSTRKLYKVCPNCKILMTSAFTSKSQLDEMESHVRYLQMAILRALKVVERHLKDFNRDLKKIGEVIKMSTGDDKMTIKTTQWNSKSIPEDVLEFRECILNAVTNLEHFRREKDNKSIIKTGNHRKPQQNLLPEVVPEDDDNENNANCAITASQMETDNLTDDHDDDWLPDHDDANDDNINDESAESDQDDPPPSRPKRKKSKMSPSAPPQFCTGLELLKESPRPILGKRYFSILEPVTTSMSPFKAAIVRRTFNKTKRKPRQTEPEGPLAYHYVTYNDETDVLSVDNKIPIRFNEVDECLECTLCSYNCTGPETSESNRNTAEKKMMYHILGKHLNIFKCNECNKPMSSYSEYTKHREIHKKLGSGSEPVCEICGKVLKSIESFEDHKWVHMTKEEKEEARRQGKKDPADKFKNMPRRYQCQECGKGFRRPCELKKHMKGLHEVKGEEEREREKVMCGGCGGIFSQMTGLMKHLKLQRCKGVVKKGERGGVEEDGNMRMME